jgi:hypothetical protein
VGRLRFALLVAQLLACHPRDTAPPPDASFCGATPAATLFESYCPPRDGAPELLCFVDRQVPF